MGGKPSKPRGDKGKFVKGNPGGPGGKRPGAGRKPVARHEELRQFLYNKNVPRSATGTLGEALRQVKKGLEETDDAGNKTAHASRMIELIVRYAYGDPPKTITHDGQQGFVILRDGDPAPDGADEAEQADSDLPAEASPGASEDPGGGEPG